MDISDDQRNGINSRILIKVWCGALHFSLATSKSLIASHIETTFSLPERVSSRLSRAIHTSSNILEGLRWHENDSHERSPCVPC